MVIKIATNEKKALTIRSHPIQYLRALRDHVFARVSGLFFGSPRLKYYRGHTAFHHLQQRRIYIVTFIRA